MKSLKMSFSRKIPSK